MIRWTKDGKIVRNAPWASWDELADALDVAVAKMIAVVNHYEAYRGKGMLPAQDAYGELVRSIYDCREALRQIGADHAD